MQAPIRAKTSRLGWLALVLVVILGIHVAVGGHFWLSPARLGGLFLAGPNADDAMTPVLWLLRLPRALKALELGALLGLTGAAFQLLFRNPLAEPYVMGVASGAGLGGTLALATGLAAAFGDLGVFPCAFLGGLLAVVCVLGLAGRRGQLQTRDLLLAGVIVGSLLSSLLSLVIICSGQDSGQLQRWLLGSVPPAPWSHVALLAGAVVVCGLATIPSLRSMNAMALGEMQARALGVNSARVRNLIFAMGAFATACAVGAAGIVAFVGLVAPHLARRWVGNDARVLLPGATLVGASLLTAADLLAQRLISGGELPVGAVTAVLGAPALLYMIRAEFGGKA